MKIYISGISGTGMGPLALMAKAAGFDVCGSDLQKGAIYEELINAGVEVFIGEQDGEFLKSKLEGLDWFVYTSALPDTHKELVMAREAGIKCTKRDDLTAFLVEKLGLKMVAVAGTHGKTTTTAMIVWASLKLKLPVSYIVGTTLGFAPSGAYHEGDKYFIYEADEYDRNFLKYHPWLAVIPFVSYDHPDIYPTQEDYTNAFLKFASQSEMVISDSEVIKSNSQRTFKEADFRLAGAARRKDAALAADAIYEMEMDMAGEEGIMLDFSFSAVINTLNDFPGVGRRFEKLSDGIYSDYAHHPEEIKATIEIAKEEAEAKGLKGVVAIYQPHQNTRQHEVKDGYKDAFIGADKIYWLPTYLTRENPNLKVLSPEELSEGIANVVVSEMDDELFSEMIKMRDESFLVLLMTAGPADEWLRKMLGIL